MTADDIRRAYDEAAAEVLLEHREAIARVLGEGRRDKDADQIAAVRARLVEHLP